MADGPAAHRLEHLDAPVTGNRGLQIGLDLLHEQKDMRPYSARFVEQVVAQARFALEEALEGLSNGGTHHLVFEP